MSPEQAMGDSGVDARTDIYALGAVLYEMLVGEPPFTGPTAQAIVARVIAEKVPSLELRRETVPPHVAATATRALAKLPAARFSSAKEFRDALIGGSVPSPLAADSGVESRYAPPRSPSALPGPVLAPARGRWRLVAAGVGIAAPAAAATWWALHGRGATPPIVRFEVQAPPVVDGDGVPFAL